MDNFKYSFSQISEKRPSKIIPPTFQPLDTPINFTCGKIGGLWHLTLDYGIITVITGDNMPTPDIYLQFPTNKFQLRYRILQVNRLN